ncbi:MAG: putative cytokinetic ring protein SteA, partial [Actinomycetota bacterium]
MLGRLKRRRAEPATPGAVAGTARVDKRTKKLLTRLQPGEIAVIDHEDIDRISAEGLIQRQVSAVVNASRSSSGRYPNLGPLLLCSAAVVVIDDVGPELMNVPEGARLVIEDGRILRKNGSKMLEVGKGRVLTLPEAEKELDESKQSIATSLEQFAANTMGYIKDERDVLLEATRLPEVQTDFHGRHVLIVVRGHDYKEDLGSLRYYIREV